jgi:ribosomal protein S27AE
MILNLSVDALHTFPEGYEVIQIIIGFVFSLLTIYTYRCPRCGDPPKSRQAFTSGVLIFPRKCSKCGAPLMPDHKWAQD